MHLHVAVQLEPAVHERASAAVDHTASSTAEMRTSHGSHSWSARAVQCYIFSLEPVFVFAIGAADDLGCAERGRVRGEGGEESDGEWEAWAEVFGRVLAGPD